MTNRERATAVYAEFFGDKPWHDLSSLDKMSLFIGLEDEFGVSIEQNVVAEVDGIIQMLDKVEEILNEK